jgi:tetratricopeptide (TPR) repeat protein
VSDTHRIEELRRRVDNDPASIAFAQLGEAYRRAGDFDGAIGVCRAGLAMHPGYLSARVTLGRTLLVVGDLDGAQSELTSVLKHAPESLAHLVEALSRGNAAEGDSDMPVQDVPPELLQLERFLDAIHSYRQRSAV